MIGRQLLGVLHRRGLSLRVENGQLIVSPASKVSDVLRAEIRAHKEAIIFELRWQENADAIQAMLHHFLNHDHEAWIQIENEVEELIGIMLESGLSLDAARTQGEAIVLLEWAGRWTQRTERQVA